MHEYRPTETAIRRSSQKKSGCEAGGGGNGFMVWRLRCSKYCGRAAAERNPSLERREREGRIYFRRIQITSSARLGNMFMLSAVDQCKNLDVGEGSFGKF